MAYQYEPIDAEARGIRTLTLLPGNPTDPVRIKVHHAQLPINSWEAPAYEALSYTWGEPGHNGHATVAVASDKEGEPDTHIAITENLRAALPYLRYRRRSRALWIDTICIDQSNLAEKGASVKRMAEIFNYAARVVIWLGPESSSSTQAMKMFQWLGSQVIVNWRARSMILSAQTTQEDLDTVITRDMDILLFLLERPWFERLWVQQEAKLATHAVVVCGAQNVDWQVFRSALFCLWHFSQRRELPGETVERMNRFYILIAKTSFLLNELLFNGKTKKCTDPRDRVYALLGLIGGREKKLNIDPDYTKSAPQVYQAVIASYLKNLRRLDPIACCETSAHAIDVPSWVPDWQHSRVSKPFHFKRHPPTFDAQAHIIDERTLCAKGVRLAKVQKVFPLDVPSDATSQEIVDVINKIAPKHLWDGKGDKERIIDEFCATIIADHFRDRWNPADGQEAIESECREFIRIILAGKFSEEKHLADIPTATRYLTLFRIYSAHRAFFLTDDGRFALGPIATKPGDTICLLVGCKCPLVLQPVGSDQYKLAGECYLDSAVAGQPLLGNLPEHFRNVTSYNAEVDTFIESFRNETNGKYQREDPRLVARLGEDYCKQFADYEECHEAEAKAALEILSERNVKLEEFRIV